MSVYYCKATFECRADSEAEAKRFIEEQKKNPQFTLMKYSSEYKTIKEKKEVVDEYYKVTIVQSLNDMKEPFGEPITEVKYVKGLETMGGFADDEN